MSQIKIFKKELKFLGVFAFFIYTGRGPVAKSKIFKKELKFLGCFAVFIYKPPLINANRGWFFEELER